MLKKFGPKRRQQREQKEVEMTVVPERSGTSGMLGVLSIRECHLAVPWKRFFSVMAPALWNHFLQIRFVLILLVFHKDLKT